MAEKWLAVGDGKVAIIEGSPSVPTVTVKDLGIGSTQKQLRCIWSFDGQDIWAGGNRGAVVGNNATLWRSQDGGSTWTWEGSSLPSLPANTDVVSIFGFATNDVYIIVNDVIDRYKIYRFNGSTWSTFYTNPSFYTFNHIWGTSNTNIYVTTLAGFGARCILHYNGSWSVDAGSSASFEGKDIWGVDASNVYWSYQEIGTDVYKGSVGSWNNENVGTTHHRQNGGGNGLWVDSSTGAVYFGYREQVPANTWEIWRRAPGGGWSKDYESPGGEGTTIGGTYGIDDNTIASVGGDDIFYWKQGGSWGRIANMLGTYGIDNLYDVWGYQSDTDPPILVNQDPPPSETNVSNKPTITLDLTDLDSGIDVNETVIMVNGVIAWQNDAVDNGYSGSKSAITDGYRYSITPPGVFAYGSIITIRVLAADLAALTLDETYLFTIITIGANISAVPATISSIERFVGAIDFPFRYEKFSTANIITTGNERALEHNMRNSVMIKRGMIPLRGDLGSRVPVLPFDPNDDALREEIVAEAERSISVGEPRVTVDKLVRLYEDDEHKAQIAISYYPNNFDEESKLLMFPLQQLDID